jgi:predicted ATPase
LGDGQVGRRFLANVPGRGYQFIAPVEISEPRAAPSHADVGRSRPHNLPVIQTRLIGRAGTIRALADLLPKQRLITIIGPGGIGKTTVALALAEELLPAYEDGIRFVDLAPVDGPQYVLGTLGTALGIAIDPENAAAQLVDFLRDMRMLIVLDSCEHVIDAAASLAEQLVAGASGVHILATSREPLRAAGERVHRLQPLDVPVDPSQLTAAEALAYSAVQLFVERAAAVLDGFELSDAEAPIVSAICHKLGGIALAIELAAARVDAFGIRQLKLLLDDRFRILNQGKRTAQPRHQSLVAALNWSYEFLPETERVVLRRLSVFAGAFTLDSAIAVAGDADTDVVDG